MFDSSILDDIRSKVVLSELINTTVPLRKRGHESVGRCPFHNEKTPSFTVNDQKAFYHCFGCGAHGNVFDFLQHIHRYTFREAVVDAAQRAGITLPQNFFKASATPHKKENTVILEILAKAAAIFQERLQSFVGTEARTYLNAQRGFTTQTIDHFQIGYAEKGDGQFLKNRLLKEGYRIEDIRAAGLLSSSDDHSLERDKFRDRIMFPIWDSHHHVIGFGGRLLGEGMPKYLNSPETAVFKKGTILYNFPFDRSGFTSGHPLVVVEGYTDVMRLFQHGVTPAVAPLGTALTTDHLALMWKYVNEPLLCFDGDDAGQRAAERAAEKALSALTPGKTVSFVTLPPADDPDTLVQHKGADAFRTYLAAAVPLADFLWAALLKKYPRALPEEKALVTQHVDKLCLTIADTSVQAYYKQLFRDKCYHWGRTSYKAATKKEATPPSRPRVEPVATLHEKILIGAFMHHPELIEPLHEELALLSLRIPLHTQIQERIMSYFFNGAPIEKGAFDSYLKECGLDTVREAIANDLKIHVPGLADPSLDHKIEAWQAIYARWVHAQTADRDMDEAKRQLEANWTLANWERYKALKHVLILNDEEENETKPYVNK